MLQYIYIYASNASSAAMALNALQVKGHNRVEDGISEIKSLLERTNTGQISHDLCLAYALCQSGCREGELE